MEDQINPEEIINPNQPNDLNLKCKFCGKELSSKQNLREHLYIHTNEKPYVCTVPGCDQKFRQGSLLSMHRRIHSEIEKTKSNKTTTAPQCIYIKLTDHLKENLNIDKPLDPDTILFLKEKLGKSFYFIKKFID